MNMTINEFITRFKNGDFDSPDVKTQIEAGHYDWFCKDSSLAAKTKSLGKKVLAISKSKKIDCDKSYVFFKNNCPGYGKLYDSFSICDMRTGDVQYWVTPKSGHSRDEGKAQVCGPDNGFTEPLASGKWKDIVEWFLA